MGGLPVETTVSRRQSLKAGAADEPKAQFAVQREADAPAKGDAGTGRAVRDPVTS